MELNLREITKDGLSFRNVGVHIITYSVSLFLGLQWKDFFSEVILTIFPVGHNIFEKFVLNTGLTVLFVALVYIMVKRIEKTKQ